MSQNVDPEGFTAAILAFGAQNRLPITSSGIKPCVTANPVRRCRVVPHSILCYSRTQSKDSSLLSDQGQTLDVVELCSALRD